MYPQSQAQKQAILPLLSSILIVVIIVGIVFRFVALDQKAYWFDEVYTNLRAGGWTSAGVDQALFQNQIIPAAQLQQYQGLKPESTAADTIYSLAVEDPQHPPLYFLLARGWMGWFGSSITASRSLPALLSLLSLPLMYGLAKELFNSARAALLATALISISPLDISYAQTARQYSLLTVFILASSYALLKVTRSQNWQFWGFYVISSVLGLYTHPFFGFTLVAHGAYIGLIQFNLPYNRNQRFPHLFVQFLIASLFIIVLYTPWMMTVATHLNRALVTTSWTTASMGLIDSVKFWILSFSAILIDTNLDFNQFQNYLIRLPIILLIIIALYQVSSQTSSSTRLFILTLIFIPFLILLLPDILVGGRRSTVTRYLIPCFPGIQLAISYCLSTRIHSRRISLIHGSKTWQFLLIALLTSSIISGTVSRFSETWWSQGVSYWNHEVADYINQEKSPLVVTDKGGNGLNKGNLISLSYLLNQDVELLLMNQSPNFYLLPINSSVFVYDPSENLMQAIAPKYLKLESVYQSSQLWRSK